VQDSVGRCRYADGFKTGSFTVAIYITNWKSYHFTTSDPRVFISLLASKKFVFSSAAFFPFNPA
jgi:hypothetical protein